MSTGDSIPQLSNALAGLQEELTTLAGLAEHVGESTTAAREVTESAKQTREAAVRVVEATEHLIETFDGLDLPTRIGEVVDQARHLRPLVEDLARQFEELDQSTAKGIKELRSDVIREVGELKGSLREAIESKVSILDKRMSHILTMQWILLGGMVVVLALLGYLLFWL